jgi:uncharacterized repeat protein (TIGR01451 family)
MHFLLNQRTELSARRGRFAVALLAALVIVLVPCGILRARVPSTVNGKEMTLQKHRSPRVRDAVQVPPAGSPIKIWEAWAKGWATLQSVNSPTGWPVGLQVSNIGPDPFTIDEYVMVMSPSPEYPNEHTPGVDDTTQDCTLTFENTVPPGESITFWYGSYVVRGYFDPPAWWCTEDDEVTLAGVSLSLSGEVLPFALWDYADRHDLSTQKNIWDYQRANPTLVIGKLPLWKVLPKHKSTLDIKINITNIGFKPAGSVTVIDTLLPGFQFVNGSASIEPVSVTRNADHTTTIVWTLPGIREAIETPIDDPTDYPTISITYRMETPRLHAPRLYLPRAEVDIDSDGLIDAHSEPPVLTLFGADEDEDSDEASD